MAGPMDSADEAGLWRRWRAAAEGPAVVSEPDDLTLAAYAEDRLSPEATAAVEDWLAANSHTALDILAARQLPDGNLPPAPEAVLARAQALVSTGEAQVLAFRRPAARAQSWRGAIGWAAMAASIVIASLAGFATASDTYLTLAGGTRASLSQEVLDPPTGLFNGFDEDSSI